MRRIAFLFLAGATLLGACLPVNPQPPTAVVPSVDAAGTANSLAATQVAETLTAMPTSTEPLPPTDTPTVTETLPITETPVTETVTVTGTLPTLTSTVTAITATSTGAFPTATDEFIPRFFGTLPPQIPYGKIELINRSKVQAYISLQCKTVDGYTTIIEYPVQGMFKVSAPAGRYVYVAWVGGKQMDGSFGLNRNEELTITLYKDRVVIR